MLNAKQWSHNIVLTCCKNPVFLSYQVNFKIDITINKLLNPTCIKCPCISVSGYPKSQAAYYSVGNECRQTSCSKTKCNLRFLLGILCPQLHL